MKPTISPKSDQRLRRLITRYKLHDSIPVDLSWAFDNYDIEMQDLTETTLGWSFFGHGLRLIGVNVNQPVEIRRMTIAHEVCHHLLGHPNTLYLCKQDHWWHCKNEMQAQWAASVLLIPPCALINALQQEMTNRQIVGEFCVPLELVKLRIGLRDVMTELFKRDRERHLQMVSEGG